MRDVALRAGVGLGTVSRVVNGGASVRPQTAERVRRAIVELGFQRDEVARALRPGMKTSMIALLVGDLTNPFYAAIATSAVQVAREAGFSVLVSSVDEDPVAEQKAVSELLGQRIAGLMIVPDTGRHDYLAAAVAGGTPVVFVDRPASGVTADTVLLDNERGGWLATRELIRRGHTRVAILVAPSYHTTGQRLRGFRRAMREAGLAVREADVVRLPRGTAEAARVATERLLERADPPGAVFATTNFLSEGVVRACLGRAQRPELVGFDDFRLCDLLPMPVSVVAGDVAEMAQLATRMLLERIGGRTGPARRTVLPVSLRPAGGSEAVGAPDPADARGAGAGASAGRAGTQVLAPRRPGVG